MTEKERTCLIASAWLLYGIMSIPNNEWGILVAWLGLFSILVMKGDIQ